MRLAHLSDLHLTPAGALGLRHLCSRRAIGALNWFLNRHGRHSEAAVRAAVQGVLQARADHVVVTGDLTNLALDAEFELAASVLRPLSGHLTVVPGNHDYYSPDAVRRGEFERWFGETLWRDAEPRVWPVVQELADGVTLIAVRTAQVTWPACAFGRIGADQMRRVLSAVSRAREQRRFPVIAMHHCVHRRGLLSEATGRLLDGREFVDGLLNTGSALVLHGHDHHAHHWTLDGPPGTSIRVTIIGCGSSSHSATSREPGAFHVYDRIGEGTVQVERWRLQAEKNGEIRAVRV